MLIVKYNNLAFFPPFFFKNDIVCVSMSLRSRVANRSQSLNKQPDSTLTYQLQSYTLPSALLIDVIIHVC